MPLHPRSRRWLNKCPRLTPPHCTRICQCSLPIVQERGWRRWNSIPAPLCRAGNFLPAGEESPEAMMAAAAGDSSCSTRFSFSFPPPGPMGSAGLHPVFTQQGCSPEHCCCGFAFWGSVPPQGPHKGGKAWEHHGHPPGW